MRMTIKRKLGAATSRMVAIEYRIADLTILIGLSAT